MLKRFTTAAILTAMLLGSCVKQQDNIESSQFPVGFYVQGGTKLNIDAPSGAFAWEKDDLIYLWAEIKDGSEVFSALEFSNSTATDQADKSYFTAILPQKMDNVNYDYNCWSPKPLSFSEGSVYYKVPDVQKGGDCPVILYGRSEAGPLTAVEGAVSFNMSSRLHYLRFSLSEGEEMLGGPIRKIKFSMPEAIAGVLEYQRADGNLKSITEKSNTIVVTDCIDDYALAAIVPSGRKYGENDYMSVIIYGDDKYAELKPFTLNNRDFKAGHITGVSLKNGEVNDFYKLGFTIKENLLGERIEKVTFTLSDNSLWPGIDYSTINWILESEEDDDFTILFEESAQYELLNGKKVVIRYESENAQVSETLAINILTSQKKTEIDLHCPYLMYEDFTSADIGFNINGNLNATGHDSSTLEGTPYGLSGWTACQAAIVQGDDGNKALAIRHQNETYWLQGTYRGRVDSAPLYGIKDGKAVKVRVTFNYTGYSNGNTTPMLSYGYGEVQDAIVGFYQGGSSAIQGGELIEHIEGDKISAPKDGSASNIKESAEFEIASCTGLTRLGWDCYGSKGKSSTTQEWVFIDNIKVQIVK